MIRITWKEPDAYNWRDLVPADVLDDPALDGPFMHDVLDDTGRKYRALCTISRHGGGVDLTYEDVEPNSSWGCYPGTTRILGGEALGVQWKDPGETSFSSAAATIERIGDKEAGARRKATAEQVADLNSSGEFGSISTERLVEAIVRIGQGKFRKGLEDRWGGCALTGLTTPELLRASHIHPWSACVHEAERTDIDNGLLLAAHVDALFDRHLLTFDDDGTVRWSKRMPRHEADLLGLSASKINQPLLDKTKQYLRRHRTVMDLLDEAAGWPT